MKSLKSILATGALTAAVTIGAIAATTTSASAYVACNRWGECWRVHDRYTNYPVGLGVVIREDNWWDHHHRHYHWRNDRPDDHGYYDHGGWHPF